MRAASLRRMEGDILVIDTSLGTYGAEGQAGCTNGVTVQTEMEVKPVGGRIERHNVAAMDDERCKGNDFARVHRKGDG